MRVQVVLIGIGAALYLTPYLFGSQTTLLTGSRLMDLSNALVTSSNPSLALPLCYLSGAVTGLMGLFAVGYNLRLSMRRPKAA